MTFEKPNCSKDKDVFKKFKSILDFVKSLSDPEREKLIIEIQLETYFEEYDKSEVITNSV